MEKTKWDSELAERFTTTLEMLLDSSDREMEPYVRKEISKFLETKHTPEEVYDFCDHISKLPTMKLSNNICVGDISSFVQAVMDVSKYYEKNIYDDNV